MSESNTERTSSAAVQKAQGTARMVNITRNRVLASNLVVADTSSTRRRGLLGRTSMEPGEGLWIRPCESVHCFGMKFTIDVLYLDRKLRVRKIRSSMKPWRISACLVAHSVLELPEGVLRETGTQVGDEIQFESL